jgi:hypothetical protein
LGRNCLKKKEIMPLLLSTHPRINLIVLLILTLGLYPRVAGAAPAQADQTPVTLSPSISPATVERIVAGTPLAPYAATIYQVGQQRQIDPAFALAIWTFESSLDTAGASVGNNNPGNLICAAAQPPVTGCAGRWAVYPDLAAAVTDWYRYIDVRYVQRGLTTVETILPVYAPEFENDTQGYIARVNRLIQQWQSTSAGAVPATTSLVSVAAARSAARPMLWCGAAGPAVAELQTRLNGWITAIPPVRRRRLVVDGLFGPRTAAAVWAFQQAHGLIVDGIVGPQTWQSLLAGSATTPAPSAVASRASRLSAALCPR